MTDVMNKYVDGIAPVEGEKWYGCTNCGNPKMELDWYKGQEIYWKVGGITSPGAVRDWQYVMLHCRDCGCGYRDMYKLEEEGVVDRVYAEYVEWVKVRRAKDAKRLRDLIRGGEKSERWGFITQAHKWIAYEVEELRKQGKPVDLASIFDGMSQRGTAHYIGGSPFYLTGLMSDESHQ